jgi:hypothetical protein
MQQCCPITLWTTRFHGSRSIPMGQSKGLVDRGRALLGSGAGRLLRSPTQLRAFNVAMAVLLVLSVLPVLIEG